MVRRAYMLTHGFVLVCIVSVSLGITASPSQAASSAACSGGDARLGDCPTTSRDFSVDPDQQGVTGEATSANKRRGSPGKPATPARRPLAPRPLGPKQAQQTAAAACIWNEGCGANRSPTDGPLTPIPGDRAEPDTPARVITVQDVARYLPATATLHTEPDGWAVVDVPANFWVDVAPVTVDGELLGAAAEVRFTPRAYRWDYGDSASQTTTAPGATWAALGQEELTETATSHEYEKRAVVQPTVTVLYAAEYRLAGGPWTGIDGAVIDTTPPIRTLVVRERTALTNRT